MATRKLFTRLRRTRGGGRIPVTFLALAALGLWAGARREVFGASARPDPLGVALDHHYNLEYDAARQQLDAWLTQHPTDLRALNYLGTVLLHREMFYRGVLETHIYGEMGEMFRSGKMPQSPGFRQELFGVLEKAQALAENRLKQNPGDQEAMYWAGSAHATRAVFYFTLAKAYLPALRESVEARKYHAQLLAINPNFVDTRLVIGINDYVAGSLPWYIKALASLVGYRGSRARGLAEVKRVTEEGHWASEDAKFILAILYRRERMFPETLRVLQGLEQSYPRNFLLSREIAGIYEIQGNLRAAADIYDALVAKYHAHQFGNITIPAAKILYEAGHTHVRLGESAEALAHYEEAGTLPGSDIYVYRAELAAADLYRRQKRPQEAYRKYQRVARAVPKTEEGKAARRALKKFQESGEMKAGGAG